MSLFLSAKGVTALDIPFNIKRAREVMQSGNYTYARKLLGDVLKVQPGNVTALGLFLEVVKRKEKRKGSAFGLLKGSVAGFLS